MSHFDQPPSPRAPLYSVRGIIIATVLGSIAAGVLMIALNYLALGRENLAKSVGLAGIGIFLAFIGITAFVLPIAAAVVGWRLLRQSPMANPTLPPKVGMRPDQARMSAPRTGP